MHAEYDSLDDLSFSSRRLLSTSVLPSSRQANDSSNENPCDIIALAATIADVYANPDVLEMEVRVGAGEMLGSGKVSQVSTVKAQFNQPSMLNYLRSESSRKVVVIKRSETRLFSTVTKDINTEAMRSFITELRILGSERLRKHPNIVTILGIHWDCLDPEYPEPLILLEKATCDLQEFQQRYNALTFSTKTSLARDIARGLSALHSFGVIHGDLKLQNVLIFRNPNLTAKLADFSHSFLNTGETRRLVGGTPQYSAPEWESAAPTNLLLRTDVYSYGLVFANLMVGFNILQRYQDEFSEDRESREALLKDLKASGRAAEYVKSVIQDADDKNPELALDDFPLLMGIVDLTLQINPLHRDLGMVLASLNEKEVLIVRNGEKLSNTSLLERVSIPYQALQPVSEVIKQHIVDALRAIAESEGDPRRADACFELCVCYLGEFGVPILEESNEKEGLKWLLEAARLGNLWARSLSQRISQALQLPIPTSDPVEAWLQESAAAGSRIALETLKALDPNGFSTAVEALRSKSSISQPEKEHWTLRNNLKAIEDKGVSSLFVAASSGDCNAFDAERKDGTVDIIKCQNSMGDTLLLCASKSGKLDMVKHLAHLGCDGSICNEANENPLHFLGAFDEIDIPEACRILCATGASPITPALEYTGSLSLESRPLSKGIPALRAIALGQPTALKCLLKNDTNKNNQPSGSTVRSMFSTAILLYDIKMIQILQEHYATTQAYKDLSAAKWWRNGRLRNIAEICVLGPVSANPNCGIDFPDRFWRYANHGTRHVQCVAETLEFLRNLGFDFHNKRCAYERNALFFAIKEGRRDAARWLMSGESEVLPREWNEYEPFGKKGKQYPGRVPPLVTLDLQDIRERISWASEQQSQDDALQNAMDMVVDYVADPLGWSRTHQRRRNSNVIAEDSDNQSLNSFEISSNRSNHRDSDQSQSGEESDHDNQIELSMYPSRRRRRDLGEPFRSEFTATNDHYDIQSERRRQRTHIPASSPQAELTSSISHHTKREGLIKAVIHAIRCGNRGIFLDLLWYQRGDALHKGIEDTIYVCVPGGDLTCGRNPLFREDGLRDFSHLFPGCANFFRVTNAPHKRCACFKADSTLNYSLLYMTTIARSVHRDLYFAEILLTSMGKFGIPAPLEWTSRNPFEDACLSSISEFGQATPLYHAAALRWPELSELLMKHGAGPQSDCFYTNRRRKGCKSSVLSRLIATTANTKDEVSSFLATATRLGCNNMVKVDDIMAIFILNPHPMDAIRWGYDGLIWSGFEHEESTAGLWQAIVKADVYQAVPLRLQVQHSRLIIQAARSRDLDGVNGILDLGFDPNGHVERRKPWRLQTTALDMVAWTADVPDSDFEPSSLLLKERDLEIAGLLRRHGGERGREYTWEFQIFSMVMNSIFPLTLLESSLCFIIYWAGKGFWYAAKLTVNSCPDKDPHQNILWWPMFVTEKIGGPSGMCLAIFLLFLNSFGGDYRVNWCEFFAFLFPMLFWIIMVIFLATSCAPQVGISLGGIALADVLGTFIWCCVLAGYWFNAVFFKEFVVWRIAYLSKRFHGNCRWQVLLKLLRSEAFGRTILLDILNAFKSITSQSREVICGFRTGRIRLADSESAYRRRWWHWPPSATTRNADPVEGLRQEPPREHIEENQDHQRPFLVNRSEQGRKVGFQTLDLIKHRVWPILIFPLVKLVKIIDEVALYSRRLEIRRSRRFAGLPEEG